MHTQNGQTLIETLVASFILVMGITAALTLATYSLSATTNIRQQTIGLGLAREGIEVVKNMRDTNWLRGTLSTDCYDFLSGEQTALCYQDWLNPSSGTGYDFGTFGNLGAPLTYYISYNPNDEKPWSLVSSGDKFGLDLYEPDPGSITPFVGYLYNASGTTASASNSGFGRRITIAAADFSPFDQNTGPRLKVTSEVWWESKNCPRSDIPLENDSCKAVLETYLTNWRNY